MNITNLAAKTHAFLAQQGGETIAYGVATIQVTTQAFSMSQASEWIPEGALNAANADPRLFDMASTVAAQPTENKQVTWRGSAYTVVRAFSLASGGVWRIICYRTAPTAAQVDDTAQDAKW